MNLAEQSGRSFFGFNCGNMLSYDSLANGGYTELKDKIISLKDEWSSDHYRSIAEDYLQATFEILLKAGKKFDREGREDTKCRAAEPAIAALRAALSHLWKPACHFLQ